MNPFIRPNPVEHPAIRLVVFHHAGGSASSYFPLTRGIPPDWDLLLLDNPGRGKRYQVEPATEMSTLVTIATNDILTCSESPIALFGHSLGGLLAAEVARSLQRSGVTPVWLGVSGRAAPNEPPTGKARLPELPDDELMRQLTVMGGIPERLTELPESYRARMLDAIRTDLRLVDSYAPDIHRTPLAVPLTAFGGCDDSWAPPSAVTGWAQETSASFRQRFLPGGHFYFLGAAFKYLTEMIVHEIHRCL